MIRIMTGLTQIVAGLTINHSFVFAAPKSHQALGHAENEAVRNYGLFLTSLHDR